MTMSENIYSVTGFDVEIQAQHWVSKPVREPVRRLGAQREAVAVRKPGGRWIDIPWRNIFLGVSVGAH